MVEPDVFEADLLDPDDGEAIVALLDTYSPTALPADVRKRIVPGLRGHGNAFVLLARDGSGVIGAAICFVGFSTFAGAPLVNLHDLVVHPDHRGRGIGSVLLNTLEARARTLGCCKITLEVRDTNPGAHALYTRQGFDNPEAVASPTWFLEKPLS
jgi:GNAT superfamily N-acetyltransferase